MDFINYVSPELLIVVPVLYGLGAILKQTKKIKDNYIPAILTGVGVALCCLYEFTDSINTISLFSGIVQGILVTAAAVYSNQLFKQCKK